MARLPDNSSRDRHTAREVLGSKNNGGKEKMIVKDEIRNGIRRRLNELESSVSSKKRQMRENAHGTIKKEIDELERKFAEQGIKVRFDSYYGDIEFLRNHPNYAIVQKLNSILAEAEKTRNEFSEKVALADNAELKGIMQECVRRMEDFSNSVSAIKEVE